MSLEDHLGDILGKARASAGVSGAVAARAAGLSENDYSALEQTGKAPAACNLRALAETLALNPKHLEGIAQGWTPPNIDLNRWRHLRQIASRGPSFTVNCFLIWDEKSKAAALFDTGFEPGGVFALLDQEQLDLHHLFITHTHHDHVAALEPIRARCPAVQLHSSSKHAPASQRNREGEVVSLGGLRIAHRDTPGHAEDGVTYVVTQFPEDAPAVAVVGDAVFAGSMGGAKQLADLAKRKIRDQILSLPSSTLICPGHGPVTTVGEELAHNPFFS